MSSKAYTIGDIPQDITNICITLIRIVAHTMGPISEGAQLSQNHWSIYLVHDNGSVRINMQTDLRSSSSRGLLNVTSHEYDTASKSAVKYWDFPVSRGLAVYYVIQAILDNGRWAYDMAEGGVGCRYWISVVMKDLVELDYVSATSRDGVVMNDIINYNYSINMAPIALEVKQGRFLKTTPAASSSSNQVPFSQQPSASSSAQGFVLLDCNYVDVSLRLWGGNQGNSMYRFETDAGLVEKRGDDFFAGVHPSGNACMVYYGVRSERYYWTWELPARSQGR